MIRKIIQISEDKCNGCGACATACHEGAIAMVNGKAKLIRDDYCDGLGDCLPACPTGAITFVEREAAAYNEAAVLENKKKLGKVHSGCPGSAARTLHTGQAQAETAPLHSGVAARGNQEQTHSGCPGSAARTLHAGQVQAETAPLQSGMAAKENQGQTHSGCPGSAARTLHAGQAQVEGAPGATQGQAQNGTAAGAAQAQHEAASYAGSVAREPQSMLSQWPVQIKLVPVNAPYFDGAKLLIAADCAAYAYAAFHEKFIKGHITLIGCPKLDDINYADKLTAIIRENNIKSVTVVRMEVPCCGGLEAAARQALQNSGKFIPWQVATISVDGKLLDE